MADETETTDPVAEIAPETLKAAKAAPKVREIKLTSKQTLLDSGSVYTAH